MQETVLSDWVRSFRDLARRAGRTDLLEAAHGEVARLRRDGIYLIFAGGTNFGKSTRINALLGRSILPVSSMRSTSGISIRVGKSETAVIDGETKPFSVLDTILQKEPAADVEVSLTSDWLEANRLCLVERPPLDASDEDLESILGATLRGADMVVHLVNALMPINHLDAALLTECARRELPVIVVVSKGDHLSTEDRSTVLQHVERHIAGSGLKAPVIDTEAAAGIEDLREAIDTLVASVDVARIRLRQSKEGLFTALDQLELVARAGLEAQELNSRKRSGERKKRQQGFEAQDLLWTEIEQCFEARRHKLDEQVRQHLERNRAATLEALLFDLERSRNVGQWWNRDLSFRLQRELKGVSGQVSSSISRLVAGDIRWLQEQLRDNFKLPLSAPFVDPGIAVDDIEIEPSDVALADMRNLRVASRLGTAATVILAGLVLTQASIGGIMLAVSSMSGLAADQIAQKLTDKDRSAVRGELDRLVQQVWLDRATQISARLKNGYDEIIVAMKREQENWHESQELALSRPTEAANAVDWQQLLEDTQALAAKMMRRGEA